MIEFTEWAKEILTKSQQAAARFDPDAKIRLARVGGTVQAILIDDPDPTDEIVSLGGLGIFVEKGLEGLVDVEEPHDRIVLKPLGAAANVRAEH